jgi:hypothetical protein
MKKTAKFRFPATEEISVPDRLLVPSTFVGVVNERKEFFTDRLQQQEHDAVTRLHRGFESMEF